MTNPRYVYMPAWRGGRGWGTYMLDGSIEENFVMDLDANVARVDSEVAKVFFTQEEAMDSWQPGLKDKYLVVRIDLYTGEWEEVL